MTKYILALLFMCAPLSVWAQTLVADVDLTVTGFIQTGERSYDVYFTLENGEGIQPGVEYALVFKDKVGIVRAGIKGEESITLSNSFVGALSYSAPEQLGDTYTVALDVRSQDGFPLAYSVLGEVQLEGEGSTQRKSFFEETDEIENVRILPGKVQVVATVAEESEIQVEYCGSKESASYAPEMSATVLPFDNDCTKEITVVVFDQNGRVLDESVYVFLDTTQEYFVYAYLVTGLIAICFFLYVVYRKRNRVASLTLTLLLPLSLIAPFHADAAVYKERLGFSAQALGGVFGCNVLVRIMGPGTSSTYSQRDALAITYQYNTTDCRATMTSGGRIGTGSWKQGGQIGGGTYGEGSFTLRVPSSPGLYDIYVSGGIKVPTAKERGGYASKSYPSTRSANPLFHVTVVEPPKPKAWLKVEPSRITEGEKVKVTWGSESATWCVSRTSPLTTGRNTSGSRDITLKHAQEKTFKIDCNGTIATATVLVEEGVTKYPEPSATFSADKTEVEQGEAVVLTWDSIYAYDCRGWNFSTGRATEGNKTVYPNTGTTYGVTCWEKSQKGGQKATASQYVAVEPAPPLQPPEPVEDPVSDTDPLATATLEVRNATQGDSWTDGNITIHPEDQIMLRWDSTYTTHCSGSNVSTGGGTEGTQSSVSEPAAGESITYAISCTGSGDASDSLRVTTQAIKPSLSADSTRVREGERVTFTYNLRGNNPAACRLHGPGVSITPTEQEGSMTARVHGDSTFILSCTGGSDEITVELIPRLFDS